MIFKRTIHWHKSSGFTLIELLLAMSITAISAVMAYQAMDSAGRLAEVTEEEGDDLYKLSSAVNLMAKDFRQVASRPIRDPDGNTNVKPAFSYDEFALPMLEFTRAGKLNPQLERFQRDHLERVAYHLDDDKLIRYSWPMVDRYSDLEPQKIVLFDDVETFSVKLLTIEVNLANISQNSRKTYEKWPPLDSVQSNSALASKSMPQGIEISIETKRWGKLARRFELVDIAQ